MKRTASILLLVFIVAPAAFAAEQRPGKAAIASAHPLASQAGMEIIEKGGNAFDAAVAVSAALSVVEQFSGGLGGGGFWLLHRADDGFEIVVDGREVAPAAATVDMYLDEDGNVIPGASREGPLAAGIPGTVAGLVHISETYGRLPLADSLAPAISLARDGFPVFDRMRRALESKKEVLSRWEEGRRWFRFRTAEVRRLKVIDSDNPIWRGHWRASPATGGMDSIGEKRHHCWSGRHATTEESGLKPIWRDMKSKSVSRSLGITKAPGLLPRHCRQPAGSGSSICSIFFRGMSWGR